MNLRGVVNHSLLRPFKLKMATTTQARTSKRKEEKPHPIKKKQIYRFGIQTSYWEIRVIRS